MANRGPHLCKPLPTGIVVPDNAVNDLRYRDVFRLRLGLDPLDKRLLDMQGPSLGFYRRLVRQVKKMLSLAPPG